MTLPKKLVIGGGIVVFLLVLGAVVVRLAVHPEVFKPQIEQAVLRSTGLTLHMEGPIRLSYFPWIGIEMGTGQPGWDQGVRAGPVSPGGGSLHQGPADRPAARQSRGRGPPARTARAHLDNGPGRSDQLAGPAHPRGAAGKGPGDRALRYRADRLQLPAGKLLPDRRQPDLRGPGGRPHRAPDRSDRQNGPHHQRQDQRRLPGLQAGDGQAPRGRHHRPDRQADRRSRRSGLHLRQGGSGPDGHCRRPALPPADGLGPGRRDRPRPGRPGGGARPQTWQPRLPAACSRKRARRCTWPATSLPTPPPAS